MVAKKARTMSQACRDALARPEVQAKRLAALRAAFAARPKATPPVRPKYGTQEWRAAISAARVRYFQTEAGQREAEAIGNRSRGVKATMHARRLNSLSRREWWSSLSSEAREQLLAARSRGQKNHWSQMTHAQRVARTITARGACAAVNRAQWQGLSEEQRLERMRPVWRASFMANPSSIEVTVAGLLDQMGVVYQRQVPIGRYVVDFVVASKQLVIECDGAYWHALPGCAEKDARRDAFLRASGYDVLRLPEAQIKSGEAEQILSGVA